MQVFTWGDYNVIYTAKDNSSNIGQCQFKVHVTREFCADLPDPINGLQVINNTTVPSNHPHYRHVIVGDQICNSKHAQFTAIMDMNSLSKHHCSTHAGKMEFGDREILTHSSSNIHSARVNII